MPFGVPIMHSNNNLIMYELNINKFYSIGPLLGFSADSKLKIFSRSFSSNLVAVFTKIAQQFFASMGPYSQNMIRIFQRFS